MSDERDEYMDERTADLPPLDPTDRQKDSKSKSRRVAKDSQRDLDDAYSEILSTRNGRLVMFDRLDKMGYWLVPFDPASPHMTAYLNGRHVEAHDLFNTLWLISPDAVLTMMKENRT